MSLPRILFLTGGNHVVTSTVTDAVYGIGCEVLSKRLNVPGSVVGKNMPRIDAK